MPASSTRPRPTGSEKRAMPQTSLSFARWVASGKAIWPAGPVMRIFSSESTPRSVTSLAMATYSYNLWNHSCQWGIPATLPEQIAGAAAAGYDHVGFDVPSLLAHEADGTPPEKLGAMAAEAGVPCY